MEKIMTQRCFTCDGDNPQSVNPLSPCTCEIFDSGDQGFIEAGDSWNEDDRNIDPWEDDSGLMDPWTQALGDEDSEEQESDEPEIPESWKHLSKERLERRLKHLKR